MGRWVWNEEGGEWEWDEEGEEEEVLEGGEPDGEHEPDCQETRPAVAGEEGGVASEEGAAAGEEGDVAAEEGAVAGEEGAIAGEEGGLAGEEGAVTDQGWEWNGTEWVWGGGDWAWCEGRQEWEWVVGAPPTEASPDPPSPVITEPVVSTTERATSTTSDQDLVQSPDYLHPEMEVRAPCPQPVKKKQQEVYLSRVQESIKMWEKKTRLAREKKKQLEVAPRPWQVASSTTEQEPPRTDTEQRKLQERVKSLEDEVNRLNDIIASQSGPQVVPADYYEAQVEVAQVEAAPSEATVSTIPPPLDASKLYPPPAPVVEKDTKNFFTGPNYSPRDSDRYKRTGRDLGEMDVRRYY